MPDHDRIDWPRLVSWILLVGGVLALSAILYIEASAGRRSLARNERLLRAVMYTNGWTPHQIEAIAVGIIDPYHTDAGPGPRPQE